MSFKQILDNCLEANIGKGGVATSDIQTIEKLIVNEIEPLKAEKLKLFDFSDIDSKCESVDRLIEKLSKRYSKIYILGTGGSTICGQAICGLYENHEINSRIHFVDNIDPKTFEFIREQINLKESLILVISKSGGTLETITQFAFFTKLYEEKLGEKKIKNHFIVISDEDNNPNIIRNIAAKLDIPVYAHEKVGGRFSLYSLVGLVPAAFSGLNIHEFLKGANDEVSRTFNEKNSQSITGTALNHLLAKDKNISSTVMMPYVDRLKNFTTWFAQIWAESLGKTELATTPIRSLGTLDQHSQMQLYLEGKKDKFFNVMYVQGDSKEFTIKLNHAFDEENLSYISGKHFTDVMNSAALATVETLAKNGSPVRAFEIDKLNEYTLGNITMHFILETVLLARLWKINPFDQPAVEQGKKLTIEKLKKLP